MTVEEIIGYSEPPGTHNSLDANLLCKTPEDPDKLESGKASVDYKCLKCNNLIRKGIFHKHCYKHCHCRDTVVEIKEREEKKKRKKKMTTATITIEQLQRLQLQQLQSGRG